MADVQCTAVLDGYVLLPDGRHVPWGGVIIRRPPFDERPFASMVVGRLCRVAYGVDVAPNALPVGTALISRDPALFVGCLALQTTGYGIAPFDTSLHRTLMDSRLGFPEHAPERSWFQTARRILHEDYALPLRMREIASRIGVHPVHVSRGFSHRYGVTMTRYLRDLRLARASELLATTDQPLSRIALATGFADHAHFTRLFVERVGRPPSAVRLLSRTRRVA